MAKSYSQSLHEQHLTRDRLILNTLEQITAALKQLVELKTFHYEIRDQIDNNLIELKKEIERG